MLKFSTVLQWDLVYVPFKNEKHGNMKNIVLNFYSDFHWQQDEMGLYAHTWYSHIAYPYYLLTKDKHFMEKKKSFEKDKANKQVTLTFSDHFTL